MSLRIGSKEGHSDCCVAVRSKEKFIILCQLKPCINGKDFVLSLQMLIIQGEWHVVLIFVLLFLMCYHRLPVKTLQLEQMAVMGSAEEPSVVASRMRLAFSTLEVCGWSVLSGHEFDLSVVCYVTQVSAILHDGNLLGDMSTQFPLKFLNDSSFNFKSFRRC
ncbi:hypothetical protein GW17_00009646 [Ensete ventricosum]|nr:hypothetical protein GW17_00009646 [Ensete ventricosum]